MLIVHHFPINVFVLFLSEYDAQKWYTGCALMWCILKCTVFVKTYDFSKCFSAITACSLLLMPYLFPTDLTGQMFLKDTQAV